VKRLIVLIYGLLCYAAFFGTFLYAIGFLANFGVPKSIDSGPAGPLAITLAIDLALLSIFALQHSVMARPAFKRWWTRIVPLPAERSTYVLASSAAMWLLFWGWQPIPGSVFTLADETARAITWTVFGLGVGLVLYATFLIDHFDLFGLRQVVLYFRGQAYSHKRFSTPSLYRHIRHPLYVGWFVTFWATPDMTWGHLLFAGVSSTYILVAVAFEERDLLAFLGDDYAEWRRRTPKFIPSLSRQRSSSSSSGSTRQAAA